MNLDDKFGSRAQIWTIDGREFRVYSISTRWLHDGEIQRAQIEYLDNQEKFDWLDYDRALTAVYVEDRPITRDPGTMEEKLALLQRLGFKKMSFADG